MCAAARAGARLHGFPPARAAPAADGKAPPAEVPSGRPFADVQVIFFAAPSGVVLAASRLGSVSLRELELARDDAFGFFERTTHRKVPLLEGYPEEYSDDESVRREARKKKKKDKKGKEF